MARWLAASALAVALLATAVQASPEPRAALAARVCSAAEAQAKANGIDPSFFARLLWRESLFDPNVVSPKGAQGIAQFMPETAAKRGLADPFDPIAAVGASAAYLAELKKTFGNIGLAAAAYNAGEQRITDWLGGKGGLPEETRDYVAFITGHQADEWREMVSEFQVPAIGAGSFGENCVALATRKGQLAGSHLASAAFRPWGALLAVSFNENTAVGMFRRLKLRFPGELANRDPLILRKRNLSRGSRRLVYVMLGEQSRAEAEFACQKLTAGGAPCIVRKN
jgi:hypothetical protein